MYRTEHRVENADKTKKLRLRFESQCRPRAWAPALLQWELEHRLVTAFYSSPVANPPRFLPMNRLQAIKKSHQVWVSTSSPPRSPIFHPSALISGAVPSGVKLGARLCFIRASSLPLRLSLSRCLRLSSAFDSAWERKSRLLQAVPPDGETRSRAVCKWTLFVPHAPEQCSPV